MEIMYDKYVNRPTLLTDPMERELSPLDLHSIFKKDSKINVFELVMTPMVKPNFRHNN